MTRPNTPRYILVLVALCLGLTAIAAATSQRAAQPTDAPRAWATDSDWYGGKAEWALYDATRVIYGQPRAYEATIFTNKQKMDPSSTTKASGRGGVEVFKHNVSEVAPTENYDYRFITTSFVRTDTLAPYKLVASTQEDCGATYHRFVMDGNTVDAREYSYFPNEGEATSSYSAPRNLAFHDMLTLTLRNYPFDDPKTMSLDLIKDQSDTHAVSQKPNDARVEYIGAERLTVPYGEIDTHHLRVTHARDGGTTSSDYWFADDHRHVLVQYEGPYGVTYRLKRLEWWAYWGEPRP
ncbi:MAG: DUF3108 domain-containing protein [Planctomycetota bacterium]